MTETLHGLPKHKRVSAMTNRDKLCRILGLSDRATDEQLFADAVTALEGMELIREELPQEEEPRRGPGRPKGSKTRRKDLVEV